MFKKFIRSVARKVRLRFGGPGSLEGNRDLLEGTIGYGPNFLQYHKGWFQNTLPMESQNITDIAVLRLDSDWYASTQICLEHLYDKVVSGGFIIIDDYRAYEGCKKATDDFLQNTKKKIYLNRVDLACRYFIKK